MKYGITENMNGTCCANCGRMLATDGVYFEKFCPDCGAPLKKNSADIYEGEIKKQQLRVVETIIFQSQTRDVREILNDLKKELS